MDYSDPTLGPIVQQTFERIVDSLIVQTDFRRQQDAISYTLQGFNAIAKNLAGLKGRKSLIWLTADAPFVLQSPTVFTALDPGRYVAQQDAGRHTVGDFYVETMQALSQANVAVYPVDVRGLQGVGLSGANTRFTKVETARTSTMATVQAQMASNQYDSIDTMKRIAEMTGGVAFYNSNDLAGAISRAAGDGESYYMLSYRLNTDDNKAGWRKLSVKVKADGVKVRARQGFFVTQATGDPAQMRKLDLYSALHSPLNQTGMPLDVYLTATPGEGKTQYVVEMTLPPNTPDPSLSGGAIDLDFGFLIRDPEGNEKVSRMKTFKNKLAAPAIAQIRDNGITIKESFDLPPGAYSVAFVTRDNLSGRVGSVAVPLKVEATQAKK
jgi:hypothetical protein